MSRTFAAAALGLPALRSVALPELEGTALRLHVAPVVTARWPSGDRGYALLSLCPGDDPDEPAALVRLPLDRADALAKACAAFNVIMDAAEPRAMTLRETEGHSAKGIDAVEPPPPSTEPRAQALVTAAAQLAILAGLLPAVLARCIGLL